MVLERTLDLWEGPTVVVPRRILDRLHHPRLVRLLRGREGDRPVALAHLDLGGGLVGADPGHVCRFRVGIQVRHRAVVDRAGRVRAERTELHIDRLMLDGAHIVVVGRLH